MTDDTNRFCRSCDICQKTIDKGTIRKDASNGTPFQRIAVDFIGPLNPPSKRAHKYIFTIIDYATRYCDALPLKTISTVEVAEYVAKFCRGRAETLRLKLAGKKKTKSAAKWRK